MRDERGMTRREAIGAALAAPLAATLAATLAACAVARGRSTPAPRVVLSLAPYASRLWRDPHPLLASLRTAGADLVELPTVFPPPAIGVPGLRAALDRAGLAAVAARVTTGRLYRGWGRTLDAARALGCTALACASPGADERPTTIDWVELGGVFGRAASAAAARGVSLRATVDAAWLPSAGIADPLGAALSGSAAAPFEVMIDVIGIGARAEAGDVVGRVRASERLGALLVGEAGVPPTMEASALRARELVVLVPPARDGVDVARIRAALEAARVLARA
jgi:hypothetical protein